MLNREKYNTQLQLVEIYKLFLKFTDVLVYHSLSWLLAESELI